MRGVGGRSGLELRPGLASSFAASLPLESGAEATTSAMAQAQILSALSKTLAITAYLGLSLSGCSVPVAET